jgi:hypothetical protein
MLSRGGGLRTAPGIVEVGGGRPYRVHERITPAPISSVPSAPPSVPAGPPQPALACRADGPAQSVRILRVVGGPGDPVVEGGLLPHAMPPRGMEGFYRVPGGG